MLINLGHPSAMAVNDAGEMLLQPVVTNDVKLCKPWATSSLNTSFNLKQPVVSKDSSKGQCAARAAIPIRGFQASSWDFFELGMRGSASRYSPPQISFLS
jgi:hypothetical protein